MSKKTTLLSIVLIVLVTFWGSNIFDEELTQVSTIEQSKESAQVAEIATDTTDVETWVISMYDELMQRIGEEEGQDWRLMSAIAYNESRFQDGLISKQGAIGLMQVMPIVGKQFNVAKEHLSDQRPTFVWPASY